MFQPQMINTVLEWERRLEFEEERRRNHRTEPYVNYLAPAQPCREEPRPSIFERLFRPARRRRRDACCYPAQRRRETQPG